MGLEKEWRPGISLQPLLLPTSHCLEFSHMATYHWEGDWET